MLYPSTIDASVGMDMVGGVKALCAFLFGLILGVGCGKSEEEKAAKEPEAKTQKADTKNKVPTVCPFCGEKFRISDIAHHKRKCPQNPNDQRMNKPASGKPKIEAKESEHPEITTKKDEVEMWDSDPSDPNNVKIEAAIRKAVKKPTGELTKADLEEVAFLQFYLKKLTSVKGLEKLTQLKWLDFDGSKLTDVKDLEKLTQLEELWIKNNPDLTKAQIDQLQKALPKCNIGSNPKK